MKIVIPLEFLKAIGEKPAPIRIYWIKWLADYSDKLFNQDFIETFIKDMEGKKIDLKTINEAYDFGIKFFEGGFTFMPEKNIKKEITANNKELCDKVINYLNDKANSTYTGSKANIDCINARIKEGYSYSDFVTVIDSKCHQWLGTEQQKYLRPITLFQAKKFENYLNEPQTLIKAYGKQKPSSISKLTNAVDKAKRYFQ